MQKCLDFFLGGYTLGVLHDKGKERNAFQQYIRKSNGLPVADGKSNEEHHHAFVGGMLAKDMGESILNLLVNQIISHHTGLHDYLDLENILKEKQLPREINKEDISINKSMLIKELGESPFF